MHGISFNSFFILKEIYLMSGLDHIPFILHEPIPITSLFGIIEFDSLLISKPFKKRESMKIACQK